MALGGFFSRLKEGLSRSTQKLSGGITAVFKKRRLDEEALEELEELLISADLGTEAARKVIAAFRRTRFGKEVTDEEIKQALAEEIAAILAPVAQPLELDPARKPHVVLVVGVNGVGKTTTIGKLAQIYQEQGKRAVMAAGDTFRAAAVELLTHAAAQAPLDGGLAFALGEAYERQGDHDRALAQMRQVLVLDPANAEATRRAKPRGT